MGGDPGVDTSVLDHQRGEEERKSALRSKLSSLYGIDSPVALPDKEKFRTGGTGAPILTYDASGRDYQIDPNEPMYGTKPGGSPIYDEDAYGAAVAKAQEAGDPVAKAARSQMAEEEDKLAKGSRDYYEEDLAHTFGKAERANRFALADRGLLGGSAQIDTERELDRDNALGATRLEDEVRAAVAGLRSGREQERLNATSLINSGAGEEAVAGAKSGLSRAFDNASSLRKANIAGDLFQNTADTVATAQQIQAGQAGLQSYRNALQTFYNPSKVSGRVSSTA